MTVSRPFASPVPDGAASAGGDAGGVPQDAPPALSDRMALLARCIAAHDRVEPEALYAALLERRATEIGLEALFAHCAEEGS